MRYNERDRRRWLIDRDKGTALLPSKRQAPGIVRFLIDIVETLALAAIIFVAVRVLVRNFWIEGSSMEPNLHHGQYLLVARFSYWFHPPRRGDVLVFASPFAQGRDLIKRVVGLPGERIEIKEGRVFVDGHPLDEPYARPIPYAGGPWTLQEDQVFVLGDNRGFSQDSHRWGPLQVEQIIGKAWICYWPPSAWALVPHDGFDEGKQ
jgi:signal peptidase I